MLDDWKTADVPPRLHAALGFVAKLTEHPDDIGEADIGALREAGLTDEEILDAANVCYLFTVYVRMADALGWRVGDRESHYAGARHLLSWMGYR